LFLSDRPMPASPYRPMRPDPLFSPTSRDRCPTSRCLRRICALATPDLLPVAAPDPPPLPSLVPAPIHSPPPPAMSVPSLCLPSHPGVPPPEPLLCCLSGLPHAVIQRRSSRKTPRFGALASQPRPALLINQCCQHGPSVVTVTTASKMILKVLSPPLLSWHWPRMARY
jgi:hypothetical protein